MMFGRICCRGLKNVVVVEDGIKLGGDDGADMVSLGTSFKVNLMKILRGKENFLEQKMA